MCSVYNPCSTCYTRLVSLKPYTYYTRGPEGVFGGSRAWTRHRVQEPCNSNSFARVKGFEKLGPFVGSPYDKGVILGAMLGPPCLCYPPKPSSKLTKNLKLAFGDRHPSQKHPYIACYREGRILWMWSAISPLPNQLFSPVLFITRNPDSQPDAT